MCRIANSTADVINPASSKTFFDQVWHELASVWWSSFRCCASSVTARASRSSAAKGLRHSVAGAVRGRARHQPLPREPRHRDISANKKQKIKVRMKFVASRRGENAVLWQRSAFRSLNPGFTRLRHRQPGRSADHGLGRGEQRHALLLLAHRIALGVVLAHIGERRDRALQRLRDDRDEALGRIAQDVSKAPFGRIGFLETLVGGAALTARGVPRRLLGGREFVGKGDEIIVRAPMRRDRREDGIGFGGKRGQRGDNGKRRDGGKRERCNQRPACDRAVALRPTAMDLSLRGLVRQSRCD